MMQSMRCNPTKGIAAIGFVFEGTVEFANCHHLPDNLMLPKRYSTLSLYKAQEFAQIVVFDYPLGRKKSFFRRANGLTDLKGGSRIKTID